MRTTNLTNYVQISKVYDILKKKKDAAEGRKTVSSRLIREVVQGRNYQKKPI